MATFVYETDNCFAFGKVNTGEYQGLQNDGLKHKNTDAIVCLHTRIQP